MMGLLEAGFRAVLDYVALHVITCLVPAFFLAGAMVTFISRETILRHLGRQSSRSRSYPRAAGASFFVAACSCTVIPVASGLFYGGAGIGVAFIVLWVAPAANLLALIYTREVLGGPMVAARVASALLMALIVGTVMDNTFRDSAVAPAAASDAEKPREIAGRGTLGLLALLVICLLAPNYAVPSGPYLHKVLVWAAATAITTAFAVRTKSREDLAAWMRETWYFVRSIFPLLLLGVFVVGMIAKALPEAWIRDWLGGNGLRASFLATVIGSTSYFATMTEAPFVHALMGKGMGAGPALALLLTGPGLSLPNWLAIARVFGVRQAAVYVVTIVTLGTLVGWAAGQWYFPLWSDQP